MRARRRVRGRLQTPHGLFLSHKPSHSLIHAHKLELIPSRTHMHTCKPLKLHTHTHTHTHTHEQSWGEEFRDALALPKNASALDEVGRRCACAREHGRSARADPCVTETAVDVHVR